MRKPNNARVSLNIKAAKGTKEYVSLLASKLAKDSAGHVGQVHKRLATIKELDKLSTPESRKQRKQMNVHWHGKLVPTNVRGMYAGKKGNGQHPIKIKYSANTRKTLAGVKAIMRGLT